MCSFKLISSYTYMFSHHKQSLDRKWTAVYLVELTGRLEDMSIAVTVTCGEGLHHAVDLLGFTRQTETPQELSVSHTT